MKRQAGKEAVYKLVDDFDKNESQYLAKSFQEAETRSRFIDPLFNALGWDINQTGIARKFWDVHREFSQRDNSTTKKPDYAFRVKEGIKYREKFFVEAKAPHVDLTGNIPVFQAKRYADKDDEVVEYALQRSLSPVLVAEYTAKLPDKKLLRNKLREFNDIAENSD